jgi:hypothetical protein
MTSPFESVLAQIAKLAAAGDNVTRRAFRRGDAAHLRRWVKDGRFAEICNKIFGGKFDDRAVFLLIMTVLDLRRLAESSDAFATAFALIDRAQKKRLPKDIKDGLRALADEQITPEEFATYRDQMKEAVTKQKRGLNPLLHAREKATRKRVIFCRVLSAGLHNASGRWHDAEVGALCEIAFDYKGDGTIDAVKAARRGLKRR